MMDEIFGKFDDKSPLGSKRESMMDSLEWNKCASQYITATTTNKALDDHRAAQQYVASLTTTKSLNDHFSITKGTKMYNSISTKKLVVTIKNTTTSDTVMIALPFNEGLLSLVDQMEIVETGERYSSIELSGVRLSTGAKTVNIVDGNSIKETREAEQEKKERQESKRRLEIESLEQRLEELKSKE